MKFSPDQGLVFIIYKKPLQFNNNNYKNDQWIRIENPEITPHIYSQLVFDEVSQNT
jgi:hypothetical protein